MGVKYNKCSGCEHYDGFRGDSVVCGLGIHASLNHGCNKFQPDSTANCETCYFAKRTPLYNIHCSYREKEYKNPIGYCSDYAETWY